MKKKVELLAPAGSYEALIAAIQSGADAVYMGGTKFNARRQADNFDEERLREAIEYAHLYGVKIYITLNTLVKESELAELRAFLNELKDLSIDGVIVQDLGVARLILNEFPGLPLHASTQMTIHQLEGAKLLERMGFTRVVLARELTLEEIRVITENTSLSVETFIHGALCVCYSGQCLMSSLLGGRSGNRGMCAQPCRLPYKLGDKHAYHLSPKDLSSISFLKEITDAGVTSLKIEGRMKRPEYVAIVTREYRKVLDAIMKAGSEANAAAAAGDEKALMQIFNRGGFTKGYYYGTNVRELMCSEKPNNWGIYLGKAVKAANNTVSILLEEDLETGDGLEFWLEKGSEGQQAGPLSVNGKIREKAQRGQTVTISVRRRIPPGTVVFRTSKASQLKEAEELYSNIYNRKIPIKGETVFRIGKPPSLTLTDENGITVTANGIEPVQEARSRSLTEDDIALQLSKLGDTPFAFVDLNIAMDPSAFYPVSGINDLRRRAAELLKRKRIEHYESRKNPQKIQKLSYCRERRPVEAQPKRMEDIAPILSGYIESLNISPQSLKGLDIICFEPSMWPTDIDRMEAKLQSFRQEGFSLRLVLPRITRQEDMRLLRSSPKKLWQLFDGYQIGSLGQISLLEEMEVPAVYGDFGLNIFNSMALMQLAEFGVTGAVLSPELTIAEIHDIIEKGIMPCEILVFGRLPLMITEYCPHAAEMKKCSVCRLNTETCLIDRMGYRFPMVKKHIARCYTQILNSQTLFAADESGKLHKAGASAWGLKLAGYNEETIRKIIALYSYAKNNPGRAFPDRLEEMAKRIKAGGFTRGHFFRGVD